MGPESLIKAKAKASLGILTLNVLSPRCTSGASSEFSGHRSSIVNGPGQNFLMTDS